MYKRESLYLVQFKLRPSIKYTHVFRRITLFHFTHLCKLLSVANEVLSMIAFCPQQSGAASPIGCVQGQTLLFCRISLPSLLQLHQF